MLDAPPIRTDDWQRAIASPHDFVGAKLALFLGDATAVPYLRDRLRDYIETEGKGLVVLNAV